MVEIVVTEFMDPAAVERLAERYHTRYDPDLADDESALAAAVSQARALIVRNRTQVSAALLARAPRVGCIGRLGVGLDNIDVDACAARSIAVYPATGANDRAVAEYVVSMALLLLRGAFGATAAVASGHWPRQQLMGREAAGKVLGLVGFGAMARTTAALACGMGMRIAAFDPNLAQDDPAFDDVERMDLDALLAAADVVSLHVPLTGQTRHMIGADALAAMKPDAVLVNAARGGVLDEAALVAALRAGRLAGAALDVFETEPLDAAAGAMFIDVPNLVLTPHVAGISVEANIRVSQVTADAVLAHLAAHP